MGEAALTTGQFSWPGQLLSCFQERQEIVAVEVYLEGLGAGNQLSLFPVMGQNCFLDLLLHRIHVEAGALLHGRELDEA